ncbi:hypothetical protein EW146_g4461 [Bondarzewia mesenterica]|uniref:Major facilitator superfamily (MFS) profile domain-containing protein n=1 Tax=Bondarzewia mesenterica TaxID=1095465 RepID=A0A4S4LVL8_9AGAM|nr:hypothetical protein EW146_g4461 [Bondarzewia mesenterica]
MSTAVETPRSVTPCIERGESDILNASINPQLLHPSSSKTSLHVVGKTNEEFELFERKEVVPTTESLTDVPRLPSPVIFLKDAKSKANIQFASLCWTLLLAGWNDGTTGPLLPRIQSVYHVGFAVVSLVFISNCVGFVIGSVSNIMLTDRVGFGKVIVLGSIAQAVAYCLQAPGPPFPLFVIAFAINGFGIALQDAQANGFVASYKDNAAAKMGFLHAAYGIGALAAPLVATQFAQLHHWSFHYLVSLGIALANTVVLISVFKLKTQDECLAQIGQAAGWIVTFIINVRQGGPSSGYISAGFFGGLTLGRVALLWVNQKVGEHRIIFVYVLLAIALELVVWLVPSLIGGAVAVSLVGVLLGPVYPIVMNQAGRILPRWLLTGSIGWIAGFGQTGSAILPFMTGAIANKAGIKSLQPLLVAMMGLLFVLWALVPKARQRAD